jgi:hypothetical protein
LTAAITEESAQALFSRLKKEYGPDAAAYGRTLSFKITNSTERVARGHGGEEWGVTVTRGLIEDRTIDEDMFAAMVCHELGHVFGGFPFSNSTSSAEGQADYFASKECLRRLWSDESEANEDATDDVSASVREQCDDAWSDEEDQHLCYRIARTAEEFGAWLAALSDADAPMLTTPDTTVVDATNRWYPSTQCRVDTFLQGALCAVDFKPGLVPGLEESDGYYSRESEDAAAPYSCTSGVGARPKCWFKPKGTRWDCGNIPHEKPQCSTEKDSEGVMTCNPTDGLVFTACPANQVCDARDVASCVLRDQMEQVSKPKAMTAASPEVDEAKISTERQPEPATNPKPAATPAPAAKPAAATQPAVNPAAATPPAAAKPMGATPPAATKPAAATPPAGQKPVVATPPAGTKPVAAATPPAGAKPVAAATPPAGAKPAAATPHAGAKPATPTPSATPSVTPAAPAAAGTPPAVPSQPTVITTTSGSASSTTPTITVTIPIDPETGEPIEGPEIIDVTRTVHFGQ